MRLCLALLLLSACGSSTIGETPRGSADARPIEYERDVPEPKEGSGSTSECEGVSERGRCASTSEREYCHPQRDILVRVDCAAMGKSCVESVSRGAECDVAGEREELPCDAQVSNNGTCSDEGVAQWCETTGSEPVNKNWNCSDQGLSCNPEGCDSSGHASCCEPDGSPPEQEECTNGLDFTGVCDGDSAKWCDPFFGDKALDCAAQGKECKVDGCAQGAYCCDTSTGPQGPPPGTTTCPEIGFGGVCLDDMTAKYCFGEDALIQNCEPGETCQEENACGPGARCCDTAQPSECTAIGAKGNCVDIDTVEFCPEGSTQIDTYDCKIGETCQELIGANSQVVGAYCQSAECNDISELGQCEEDNKIMKVCINGQLSSTDCEADGKVCTYGEAADAYCGTP